MVKKVPEHRRKPLKERDPNWTPTAWMKESLRLKCEHCGESIKLDGAYFIVTTWEEGEKWAELSRKQHEPKCGVLIKAKEMMKRYRDKYPNITFDESCIVYDLILSQLKQKSQNET